VIINCNVTRAYLGSNVISNPEQLISTITLIKGRSEDSLFVIHSTHCTDKAILCQENNDAYHLNEEVPKSLDGEIKTCLLTLSTNFTELRK
jgi:uncharacterized protein YbaR (Trm112 family)